ncbi:MAG: transcriptional regulator [candidate division NC10 bacterium]|nr:transcriptional regulator [candidate division NC10 bacterium]MBI2455350.1 transcriptional regulator [candidate division NC10 bacterium]MBI2562902.1 transcriptional regulator [candidate division NC10 bacterium]
MGEAVEKTRRQEIRALLSEGTWTLDGLVARYVVAKKIIIEDLEHIARSVAPRQRILILAPVCEECGFRFKDRTRFSDPSRCPRCKNEHLSPQRFRIT